MHTMIEYLCVEIERYMEFIVYCDESISKGEYCSDFYGGVLVSVQDFQEINEEIKNVKLQQNLFQEIKWTKVTENYLEKYKTVMDTFFKYMKNGRLKMRIMFRQNAVVPVNLTEEQVGNKYHLLYYQFVKHAFGFKFCNPDHEEDVYIRLYFDKIPDTIEQNEAFKARIIGLQSLRLFQQSRIKIRQDDIVEINSKDHPIQQCMDIVLGAIAFKLNKRDKEKNPVTGKRGKKTIAKEKLYKHILGHIRSLERPNFNIGITTGTDGSLESRWTDSYRHWVFRPSEFVEDKTKYKHK